METPRRTRAGIILAGGYSTRFGNREKALVKLDGQPLLVHVVRGVAPAVGGVLVNCRQDQLPGFRRALASISTDIAFIPDPVPDRGPAAGLATALEAVAAQQVAVLACDMPFVDAVFLNWLFEKMNTADGAIPYLEGMPQPTHAVFATEPTRHAAREAVRNASGSLRDVLNRLDLVEIPETRVVEETDRTSFVDVNTSAELQALMANNTAKKD